MNFKTYLILSWLGVSVAVVAAPALAGAQEEVSDVARAKALQVEGLKLLDKGNAASALEKFGQAYALVPSPKVLFNQGRAHEALGHDLEALTAYETFLGSPNMPQAAREDAQHRVDKLRTRVSFLAVTGPAGAEVLLDGQNKGKLPFDGTFAISAGSHEVRLQRDNQELHRQSLEARPGATINVNVVLQTQTTVREPSPSLAPTAPPPDTETISATAVPTQQNQQTWMRPTAWVVAGVAAGVLVLGGIEQWRSSNKSDDFNSYTQAPLTGDGRCGKAAPEAGGGQCQSLLDGRDTAHSVAVGAFITGGLLAAGAATLFVLSPNATSHEQSVAWLCAPNFIQPGAACSARF